MKAHAPSNWWIIDTLELGRTATPGELFARQGAEVCRGLRLKVLEVRAARPADIGDQLAIAESKKEIQQAQYASAARSGQLYERATPGRIITSG